MSGEGRETSPCRSTYSLQQSSRRRLLLLLLLARSGAGPRRSQEQLMPRSLDWNERQFWAFSLRLFYHGGDHSAQRRPAPAPPTSGATRLAPTPNFLPRKANRLPVFSSATPSGYPSGIGPLFPDVTRVPRQDWRIGVESRPGARGVLWDGGAGKARCLGLAFGGMLQRCASKYRVSGG